MDKDFFITTKDNPYNPFIDFKKWIMYDTMAGYNTCGYLARLSNVDDNLPNETYDDHLLDCMKRMVINDPFDIYRIVNESNAQKIADLAIDYQYDD